jgi:outer membrane protein assembly factor BamB
MIKNITRLFLNLFLLLFVKVIFSQTLVATYPMPNATAYNTFWGVTQRNDTLWIGSDSEGKLYKVTKTGVIVDSLTTPFAFNHGLAYDGSGFWLAEDFRSNGGRIYKINSAGQRIDSIITGSWAQGIGGIALDGNNLWVATYYPDFTTYPFAYAYKISLTTKAIVDTIPLRGKQVQGIAVKGDTLFYVTDNFQSDPERIYAYRKAAGDTLFSFAVPDPDGDCDPHGLYWDGQNMWLVAQRIGNNVNVYRSLYKYIITGQGSPQITTSAANINFGNVIIGQTGNQPLTINNVGTAKLIISNFTMTNPRFSITPNVVPDTINPGSSKNYTLGFTPNVFDTTSGELKITSNDFAQQVKIVTLKGKGVENGSFINVSSNNFQYNARRINSLSGYTFDIANRGTQPLVISNITFSGQRFRLDNTNVAFPITIDTQRTRTLRIWFNPDAVSSFSDSAVIVSNAVNPQAGKISLSGSGVNNPTLLGDIMWEGNYPDNPRTSFQDVQPVSIKQITDVNGDGVNDIIAGTENYLTICFNGNSSGNADTLWKFNSFINSSNAGSVSWEDAMQTIPDINNDGVEDVIIGCDGGNENVYALSGKNGQVIWEYGLPATFSDGDVYGLRADKDFNGDGKKDVLASLSGSGQGNGRHAAVCLNGINGQVIFYTDQNTYFTHDITTTEFGGAIGVGGDGSGYEVRGLSPTGSIAWTYPISGALNAVWNMKEFPDVNSNNQSEVIGFYGFNSGVFCISSVTGAQVWSTSFGNGNNGKILKLDDKDNDGYADLTMSGPQVLYRLDSRNGTTLWSNPLGSSYLRGIDDIGDVNADSVHDIAVMTQLPGKLVIADGKTGTTLFQYVFGTSLNERGDRCSALNSIDGNASKEIIGSSRDGRIKCFSGGPVQPIGITNNNNNIPDKFALYQNYPNPFNPSTTISFDVPRLSDVSVKVFDILGREVALLINGKFNSGKYSASWNGENASSGVYFYEIKTVDYREVKKMMLVK